MIYLQTHSFPRMGGYPIDACVSSAYHGAILNEEPHEFISIDSLVYHTEATAKNNIYVGSVPFMLKVFKIAGVDYKKLPNSDRNDPVMSFSDALEIVKHTPKFIKPADDIKRFTGFVHEGYSYGCLDKVPDDFKVIVADPFPCKILTEYRVYVHKHFPTDCCLYSGHWYDGMVDKKFIFDKIDYNNKVLKMPNTYTMDVALLENGETVVVEYNDMWAIGNYGVPDGHYLEMLKERYRQIVGVA